MTFTSRRLVASALGLSLLLAAPLLASPLDDPKSLLSTLDTDHDGRVSKAEFLAAPRLNPLTSESEVRARREASFARLDKDKDGFLSLSELGEMRLFTRK